MKKFLTWSHRWIGLTIGLVMVFLAVTGAGQAFRWQLEPMIYADLVAAPVCQGLPLDTLLAAAKAVHPGANAESLRFYPGGGETAQVRFSDREIVYVDPCSSTVTGDRSVFGGVFGTLEYVHRTMFFKDFKLWSGIPTLIMLLFLVIGGFALWWPRSWRAAKRSLKIDARLTGTAFLVNLHKTVGVYAFAVLLPVSFFGTAMAFDWVKQGIYWATGSDVPMGRKESSGDARPALSLEDLWLKAEPMFDGPRDVTIRLSRGPVQMGVIEASAPHARARSEIVLDGSTGEVRRFTPYAQTSLGSKVYNWGVAIHTGQAFGVVGAFVVFTASLAVPVLAYSGIASWLRRRRSAALRHGRAKTRPSTVLREAWIPGSSSGDGAG